jgi:hypothetical protein
MTIASGQPSPEFVMHIVSRTRSVALSLASFVLSSAALIPATSSVALAQSSSSEPRRALIALEADAIAYALPGYSGMINVSLANGFQIALGTGRYEVPTFLLEGEKHYDAAHWKATSTSVQVLRTTYRFNGPMKSGLAIGGVILNQNWRLRGEKLNGETKFRPLSAGLTAGYYIHVTKHFYIYPTTAFTYNSVVSGTPELQGVPYKIAKFGPNASLHVGWEIAR